jgi:general secretion pathway protein E
VHEALQSATGAVLVGCTERTVRSTLLHALIPPGSTRKIWSLEAVPVYRRPTISQTMIGTRADAVPHLRNALEAGADLIVVDDVSRGGAFKAALEASRARTVLAGHVESDIIGLLSEALDASGSALVASALRVVVAARPVRLLCPACKQPAPGGDGLFAGQRVFTPAGCETCGFTGFKGRRLLIDVWTADPDSRMLLRTGRAAAVFAAIQQMGSQIREAGKGMVLDGLTSPGEFIRVVE